MTGLVEERDLSARARRVRQLVIEEGSGEDERRRLEAFTDAMPDSYLLSNTIDRIIDHWRLYESLGTALFRSGVTHFRERGFSEFTICTADRPGLFVRLAGCSARTASTSSGAKIVTSATDVAIDTFRVGPRHGARSARRIPSCGRRTGRRREGAHRRDGRSLRE
jgi:[protein-PII] uridylyltransferase